jgi:hypothetical protein
MPPDWSPPHGQEGGWGIARCGTVDDRLPSVFLCRTDRTSGRDRIRAAIRRMLPDDRAIHRVKLAPGPDPTRLEILGRNFFGQCHMFDGPTECEVFFRAEAGKNARIQFRREDLPRLREVLAEGAALLREAVGLDLSDDDRWAQPMGIVLPFES